MDLRKAGAARKVDLVFPMPEEALLGYVVPAVDPAGHGLAEPTVLYHRTNFTLV